MTSLVIPTHKLRDFSLLADSPNLFLEAFVHFGGQLVGSELFKTEKEEDAAPTYESLLTGTTEGFLHDAVSRADLIHLSAVNGYEHLFENANTLINRMLPITFPRDNRHIVMDLSFMGKEINAGQLQQILEMGSILQTHAPVTLLLTPSELSEADTKISHLRQQLIVSEILFYTEAEISSATSRGVETFSLNDLSFDNAALPVLLATYSATQFLNLEQAKRLQVSSIAANLFQSKKSFPSWVEIQSQF